MRDILQRLRRRAHKLLRLDKRPSADQGLKARFTYVYRKGEWLTHESVSGPGSDKGSGSVRQALFALSVVVRDYSISSIADVPCGDFNWMPDFLVQHPSVSYAGFDIVAPLVAANRKAHPDRSFSTLDITRSPPPRADLIFSKDLVNHLIERDVWQALANMIRSGATYLMITSNADPEPNKELPGNFGGISRTLNLRTEPYNFPAPLYDDGYLSMWRIDDLAFVLDRAS